MSAAARRARCRVGEEERGDAELPAPRGPQPHAVRVGLGLPDRASSGARGGSRPLPRRGRGRARDPGVPARRAPARPEAGAAAVSGAAGGVAAVPALRGRARSRALRSRAGRAVDTRSRWVAPRCRRARAAARAGPISRLAAADRDRTGTAHGRGCAPQRRGPGSDEPWSEVPPEIEELLRAQLANSGAEPGRSRSRGAGSGRASGDGRPARPQADSPGRVAAVGDGASRRSRPPPTVPADEPASVGDRARRGEPADGGSGRPGVDGARSTGQRPPRNPVPVGRRSTDADAAAASPGRRLGSRALGDDGRRGAPPTPARRGRRRRRLRKRRSRPSTTAASDAAAEASGTPDAEAPARGARRRAPALGGVGCRCRAPGPRRAVRAEARARGVARRRAPTPRPDRRQPMGSFLTRGQAPAVSVAGAMLRAGMPQALLLVGPPSVGKTTLGLDIAAALLCRIGMRRRAPAASAAAAGLSSMATTRTCIASHPTAPVA